MLLCPKFPINCPVCGQAEVIRERINSHVNIINGTCPMVIVPCSFRHIGCMYQDKRCKMSKHYTDANAQHLMLLSTRLFELETKHRIDLQVCEKKFEQNLEQLTNQCIEAEAKYVLMENAMHATTCTIDKLEQSVNRLKTTTASIDRESASGTVSHLVIAETEVVEWTVDLSTRKTHFSPTYGLQNTSYTIHLWLKPDNGDVENGTVCSTVSVMLERCDTEDELPVSFECDFMWPMVASTVGHRCAHNNCTMTTCTTEPFVTSGHVSNPMVLCKKDDLVKHIDDAKLVLRFTVKARR